MTLVLEFGTLWNEALATLLTPTLDQIAPRFSFHPGTKSVLTFAGTFGRLISPFHRFVFLRKIVILT